MATRSDVSIADELAAEQQQISVAEFFEQNRQMLGFGSKGRALVTTVKEAVDNAIDAAEDARIFPSVAVTIEEDSDGNTKLTFTDNGPGIKEEQIPKVFGKMLYGSRFSKRVQRRGQQGIGISAAVLYAQESTGKPATITSKVAESEMASEYTLRIDTDNNEPEIVNSRPVEWAEDSDHGTKIELHIDANFRARARLHEYIERTAVVNPHVAIDFTEPEYTFQSERTVETLPKQPEEIRPHPHGIELGTLRAMLEETDSHSVSGFLQSEFTRVGSTTADNIIDAFLDRLNGRHFRWDAPETGTAIQDIEDGQMTLADTASDDDDGVHLAEHLKAHINRKSKRVTDALATQTATTLADKSPVSYPDIAETIDSRADTTQSSEDTTIGDTVREKATDAAWEAVTAYGRLQTLTRHIDSSTGKKKTEQDIELLATHLNDIIAESDSEQSRYTRKEVESMVDSAAKQASASNSGTQFGETSRGNITETLWESMDPSRADTPLIRKIAKDRDAIESLLRAMQSVDVISPPSKCLSPIGEEELEQGIREVYSADFYDTSQRSANSHSGEPFLVEAGIAYGGDIESEGSIDLLRFANRVPLVYKRGAGATMDVISDIGWNNYKLSDKGGGLPQGPVALVVHVASTNVPFTSESKDAIASVEVIEDEIERAIRDVARGLKKHLSQQQTLKKQRRKRDKIDTIIPEFATKIAEITGGEKADTSESTARIMNNLYIDTSDGEVTAHNYNGRESFDIAVEIEMADGDQLTETESISPDSSKSIASVDENEIDSLTVEGAAGEKLTTDELAE